MIYADSKIFVAPLLKNGPDFFHARPAAIEDIGDIGVKLEGIWFFRETGERIADLKNMVALLDSDTVRGKIREACQAHSAAELDRQQAAGLVYAEDEKLN